jgi:SAM-dependent methyltransferase
MSSPAQFWNARYGEDGFAYGDIPNDFVVEVAAHIPKGPILCLAEGEGRNAAFLASRGHAVTAMDLSAVGLEKAHRLAQRAGVSITTEVGDLAHYAIARESFAAVVCIWMHLPSALHRQVMQRVAAGLLPGGVLVFEAYTPDQLRHKTGGPQDLDMLADPTTFRAELESLGLAVERYESKERMVREGRYHDGLSAVLQVLARKRA